MRKKNKRQKFTIFDVLMYGLVGIMAIACLYPFVNVLAYSFSGANAVLSNDVTFYPKDFTLAAYQNVFARPAIWNAMRTTVIITLVGTALSLVLTIAAAYALSYENLPGRRALSGFILFTMYFSGGIIPTFLVVKNLGMYDSLAALIIPNAISVFNFVVMRTFFREIPRELYEAAQIDGAGKARMFFSITLPQISPIIFFNLLNQMIQALQNFTSASVITEGGPLKATYVLGLKLYKEGFSYFKMGYASAISWVVFTVIVAFTLLIFGSSKFWVHYGDE